MAASGDQQLAVKRGRIPSSLPPPMPKSPPIYPDLYGKRREAARLQMLDREIVLLQEDLKYVQGLHPASAYCKEVVDFVVAAADPLTPTNNKDHKSCSAWKWLCKLPCFNLQWLCCCHCSLSFQTPKCCGSCKLACNCTLPKCFQKSSSCCSTNCCNLACPMASSCLHSLCTDWSCCHMPKCASWGCCCFNCKCINRCCNCNPCYTCCL